jgi:protein-S-isoprenylcysteine O-methyltransferase Ste14
LNLAIGIGLTLLLRVRVHEEDALLKARFPDYAEYVRTTKAFVPKLL